MGSAWSSAWHELPAFANIVIMCCSYNKKLKLRWRNFTLGSKIYCECVCISRETHVLPFCYCGSIHWWWCLMSFLVCLWSMASTKTTQLNCVKHIVFMFQNNANGQNNPGRCWVKVKGDIWTEKVFSRTKGTCFSNPFGGRTARGPVSAPALLTKTGGWLWLWFCNSAGREGRKEGWTCWDFLSHCESLILSAFLVLRCLLSGKQECGYRSQTGTIALWLGAMVTALTTANKHGRERGVHLSLLWEPETERSVLPYPLVRRWLSLQERTSLSVTQVPWKRRVIGKSLKANLPILTDSSGKDSRPVWHLLSLTCPASLHCKQTEVECGILELL